MGKYIELDVAKKAFQNMDTGHVGGSTLLSPEEFSEYLDEIPTADVAPVGRGIGWMSAVMTLVFGSVHAVDFSVKR